MTTIDITNTQEIKKYECEKCHNLYNLEEQQELKPNLGYWADQHYLKKCVECYHKGNLKPFVGFDKIKEHKWYITWKGYQDKKGKKCGVSDCNETKNLLDLSADDDAKFGGLICKQHLKIGKFKLVGSWARTWEKLFDYEALPKEKKSKDYQIWGKYYEGKETLSREEAEQSLEDYKEMVNFNQYGNPADRLRHFDRWAKGHGLKFEEAERLLNT